ncbi:phosphatidate cytidylyltransferase [uncultured Amaricoccus sp.]|uniref:phosphatidate cytidylyltransferase n=1 Tax=uncultured Amaricoccus sp. TaxID=339341 RepID=UPI0026023BCC|nr:phosphatidate cytidylyltransferase [uncultured Amaricoccus sp.]
MKDAPPKPIRFGDLGLRLASGVALALIALVDLWMGGFWVAALVAVALVLMLWELHRMVTGDADLLAPSFVVLGICGAGAVFVTLFLGLPAGLACLVAGGALVFAYGGRRVGWLVGGLGYMGGAMCALIPLRNLEPSGMIVVLWLVVVVVATDVGAYFVGRMVGGPRLWARVSPGKTRSGAVGGLVAAALVGLPLGIWAGLGPVEALLLSLGASVASQAGDLLESAVKRRFGVKDASHLIPGHGGVMDRLDGLMGAVWLLAICGLFGLGSLG